MNRAPGLVRFFLFALAALPLGGQVTGGVTDVVPGERWLFHLTDELLPFWSQPAALGSPIGAFPSTRCDDGSAVDFAKPCPEVGGNPWLMQQQRYLVAQSRQVYAYGVAYHMTGEQKYLDWMKAGVDFIRKNAVDRDRGGMFTLQDLRNGRWGPRMEFRNPQELGYGLLGLSFYYYLTRDEDVMWDILTIRDHILGRYYSFPMNALQWVLEPNGGERPDDKRLVAQLDQMNAYMVLLTPVLREPFQSEWKQALETIARLMIDQFYSPQENLFFLSANKPDDLDIRVSGTDFGHTIKAMWMIRMTGLLTGKQDLVDFAARNGKRVLERAFLEDSGSWAQGVKPGRVLDLDKSWWIYAELDQFAASLALTDPSAGRYLARTNDYWFRNFVDQKAGEVWTTVSGTTHQPLQDMPKQWPWKNGYHSFEHALVGYLTSQQRSGRPAALYFAMPAQPAESELRPYFYSGAVAGIESAGSGWRVTFRDLR